MKTDDMDYMEITPLMIATSKGNLKLVQFLIEECTSGISGTSIFAETKDGNSIFAIAKRFQYSSIIDYLHKFVTLFFLMMIIYF